MVDQADPDVVEVVQDPAPVEVRLAVAQRNQLGWSTGLVTRGIPRRLAERVICWPPSLVRAGLAEADRL
jgi:hypothetical protein